MRPNGYRVQDPDRCECCAHVFVYVEYDEPNMYYCHRDRSQRPRYGARAADWERWAEGRDVRQLGHCPRFKRAEAMST